MPAGAVYSDSVKIRDSNDTGIVNSDARDFDSSDPRLTPDERYKVTEEDRKEIRDEAESGEEKYRSMNPDQE